MALKDSAEDWTSSPSSSSWYSDNWKDFLESIEIEELLNGEDVALSTSSSSWDETSSSTSISSTASATTPTTIDKTMKKEKKSLAIIKAERNAKRRVRRRVRFFPRVLKRDLRREIPNMWINALNSLDGKHIFGFLYTFSTVNLEHIHTPMDAPPEELLGIVCPAFHITGLIQVAVDTTLRLATMPDFYMSIKEARIKQSTQYNGCKVEMHLYSKGTKIYEDDDSSSLSSSMRLENIISNNTEEFRALSFPKGKTLPSPIFTEGSLNYTIYLDENNRIYKLEIYTCDVTVKATSTTLQ